MQRAVEFFFDVTSPASYLAHARLRKGFLEDVRVEWKPVLLGGLFRASGNPNPIEVPVKRAWMEADFPRWAARDGVPFIWNRAWPINSLYLMRAVSGMAGQSNFMGLIDTLFDAIWAQDLDLGSTLVRDTTLRNAGFDVKQIAKLAADESAKESLKSETEALARRGAFGLPTFFVGEEMFFGQDRLSMVAEAARNT